MAGGISSSRASRRPGPHLFSLVVGGIYLLAVATYLFVWICDPLELRSHGLRARLSDAPYSDHAEPLLFSTAASDGTDLVVIGSSSSSGFMPAMLRAAFPAAHKVANLSLEGVSAADFDTELTRLGSSPSLRHVILSLDWTLIKDEPTFGRIAGKPPYDGAWYNPVPEFSADAVNVTLRELQTGVLGAPDWFDPSQDHPDFLIGQPSFADSPQRLANLRRVVAAERAWVASGVQVDCRTMPNLQRVLVQVRKLAARGVNVDILFPTFALAFYYEPSDLPGPRFISDAFPGRGEIYGATTSLWRCALSEVASVPNVRVFAFDTDRTITSDLSLFSDAGHLLQSASYRSILARMASGSGTLTASEWPAFEAELRQQVQSYQP